MQRSGERDRADGRAVVGSPIGPDGTHAERPGLPDAFIVGIDAGYGVPVPGKRLRNLAGPASHLENVCSMRHVRGNEGNRVTGCYVNR